jgi:hypothetical protein
MNRLVKLCVLSAVMIAASMFAAPKAEAGYGYGYGYGYRSYSYGYNYYKPYYAPAYRYVPSYNYGYGGFCY